jgi:hypothetical protein
VIGIRTVNPARTSLRSNGFVRRERMVASQSAKADFAFFQRRIHSLPGVAPPKAPSDARLRISRSPEIRSRNASD